MIISFLKYETNSFQRFLQTLFSCFLSQNWFKNEEEKITNEKTKMQSKSREDKFLRGKNAMIRLVSMFINRTRNSKRINQKSKEEKARNLTSLLQNSLKSLNNKLRDTADTFVKSINNGIVDTVIDIFSNYLAKSEAIRGRSSIE